MSPQYGELRSISGWDRLACLGAPLQISTGFASWLCYCTDVAQQRSTKLCTMFGRLLGCYSMYTFWGALDPRRKFFMCEIHFESKSCVLLYWQRYCTALKHWASAKLCGVVQGMELRNLRSSSFSTEGATYIPRAAITLGIGPHSSLEIITCMLWHNPHSLEMISGIVVGHCRRLNLSALAYIISHLSLIVTIC